MYSWKRGEEMCEEHALKILILQPFSNFEGWPEDSQEREDAFERAKGWMRLMEAVGTDLLQVGPCYTKLTFSQSSVN